MDIETAYGLTNESQAKLAKAKLRGLTHTLVIEAITSDKSWDIIKDLLQLKLCKFFFFRHHQTQVPYEEKHFPIHQMKPDQ